MNRKRGRYARGQADPFLLALEQLETNEGDKDSRARARKTAQTITLVTRILRNVCEAELRDPLLAGLSIEEVTPAPDTSRLQVLAFTQAADVQAARQALERSKPLLRAAIARALQRKRTPELVFVLIGQGGADGDA